MIEYKTGDLLAEEADALVNTVNCVGHMGAGIALQFKKAWPENFRAYAAACRDGEVQPGRMLTYETNQLTPPRYIINFPTKRHWRGRSRLQDIDAGLVALAEEIRRLDLKSIAVPPLGAGLGGPTWNQVRPRIERGAGSVPRSSRRCLRAPWHAGGCTRKEGEAEASHGTRAAGGAMPFSRVTRIQRRASPGRICSPSSSSGCSAISAWSSSSWGNGIPSSASSLPSPDDVQMRSGMVCSLVGCGCVPMRRGGEAICRIEAGGRHVPVAHVRGLWRGSSACWRQPDRRRRESGTHIGAVHRAQVVGVGDAGLEERPVRRPSRYWRSPRGFTGHGARTLDAEPRVSPCSLTSATLPHGHADARPRTGCDD